MGSNVTNNELARFIDALALQEEALAAFRKGWHDADAAGQTGGRVAAGLLAISDWLRDDQPMDQPEPEPEPKVGSGFFKVQGLNVDLSKHDKTLVMMSSEAIYNHALRCDGCTSLITSSWPMSDEPATFGEAMANALRPQDKGKPELERDGNVGEVIDRRVQVYGDPITCFADIAEMWTAYIGFPIQAHQVPMMQLLMKVVRSKTSPDYSDHSDDIEGYLDIFRTIIGPDMIQARTVAEYIAKKWPNG